MSVKDNIYRQSYPMNITATTTAIELFKKRITDCSGPPKLSGIPNSGVTPPETSIAEKFESMIRLGIVNTRMKDFYDIWLLILTQQFDFDRQALQVIIRQVLKNRRMVADTLLAAFLEPFYGNPIKQDKWNAFLKDIAHAPVSLEKVIMDLRSYFKEFVFS